MRFLLLLVLMAQAAGAQQAPSQKAQRLPLQKKSIIFESPTNYPKRLLRIDPKTGKEIYYDHKPRIVPLDVKAGKYALKWIGYDGKEKMVIYQRPDVIEAIVSASVAKIASGQYLYVYSIQNLPSSGQYLSSFAVQNFASKVSPVKIDNVYVGQMSEGIFKGGNWNGFGILPTFKPTIAPGRSIELRLKSSAPPSLVECRITGGYQGIIVAGEEPATDLLDLLPGYDAWPKGYTIGPIDELKALPPTKRAEYIHQRLSQFQKLGWITADSIPWYEQNLRADNLEGVLKRADQDLKAGKITTEVFGMIQAIKQ